MTSAIYLDAQGTERPRPEAVAAINQCLTTDFGNPSATVHKTGQRSLSILEAARETIAEALNAPIDGIVFCSGATEANNWALQSFFRENTKLVASAIEHKSVLEPGARICKRTEGASFDICRVTSAGLIDLQDLERRIEGENAIVSVMHANNEIGTIQPIKAVAAICKKHGALLHVDAAQTVGKIPVDFTDLGADMMTISGHKFGGPVGSGALILNPALVEAIDPMIIGGGQEAGLRAGTIPVAMIAGMATALETAIEELEATSDRIRTLRDHLIEGVRDIPGFFLNGDMDQRLTCNFSGGFLGVDAALIMRRLPNFHFSAGSACTTGAATSHVLEAMGIPRPQQKATMRISLSWATTEADIDQLITQLRATVSSASPRLVA